MVEWFIIKLMSKGSAVKFNELIDIKNVVYWQEARTFPDGTITDKESLNLP